MPGPPGFAPADLVTFAEARGWTAAVAPVRGGHGRWRASVFARRPGAEPWSPVLSGTNGSGATAAEAPEKVALATLLARDPRGPSG